MQHTYMYNQHCTTLLIQKNKRNFSTITSRVSASPRSRHCRCLILASKKGKSVDEYVISVATTTGQLLSSQQLDYCCMAS